MRYFPDLNVLLLQSIGDEEKTVNVEGSVETEIWTHYKLIAALRGHACDTWDSIRSDPRVPRAMESSRALPDSNVQWAPAGQ